MNLIKLVNATGTLSLVALAAITSPHVLAEESGWYVGGNIGQSLADIDDQRITEALLASGLTTVSIDDDDSDMGFKLFGGYQFNRNFALEGGYFDLGEFGFAATTTPIGTLNGNTTKIQGLNLDLVGTLGFTENLSGFGRGGLTYAKTESSYSATGAVTAPNGGNKSASSYKYGLGLEYDFTDRFSLRGEAERFRIDDAVGNDGDIDLLSLGLVYRFFESKPVTPQRAYTPVPVPVKEVSYCSVLDIEFEIKRDEIQQEEKEGLAVVGAFMHKHPDTTAVIEGHSDNVGTPADNMKLSQRRADSVVNYLVNELHVGSSRLTAVGYGETRPIANESTLEGRQTNRRINAIIPCVRDVAGLTVKPARVTIAMEMDFDPDSAQIQPDYRKGLAQVAYFMKANSAVTATVEGHAADFAGKGSNQVDTDPRRAMEVSKLRAQNVVNYLVEKYGIDRSRLTAEGFGQTRRMSYGQTLKGQQENRRVLIIINYPKR